MYWAWMLNVKMESFLGRCILIAKSVRFYGKNIKFLLMLLSQEDTLNLIQ